MFYKIKKSNICNVLLLIDCFVSAPHFLRFWISYLASFHYSVLKAYASKYIFTAICASWLLLIARSVFVHVRLRACSPLWCALRCQHKWQRRSLNVSRAHRDAHAEFWGVRLDAVAWDPWLRLAARLVCGLGWVGRHAGWADTPADATETRCSVL